MQRLFFALWPDTLWGERLLSAAKPLISCAMGRPQASVDLHVTLSFIGAVEAQQVACLRERAAAIEASAFELLFDAFEYWPQARVLAATCAAVPAAAGELVRLLHAAALGLGLRPDLKPWRPHLTLLRARAADDARIEAVRWPSLALRFEARQFYLAQSHELVAHTGAPVQMQRYSRLGGWPLRAANPSPSGR